MLRATAVDALINKPTFHAGKDVEKCLTFAGEKYTTFLYEAREIITLLWESELEHVPPVVEEYPSEVLFCLVNAAQTQVKKFQTRNLLRSKMEKESEEGILKAAGAELLSEGRTGVRIHGWEIESSNRPILTSLNYEQWGEKLKTSHLPEMVFGESCLVLKHLSSGIKIHFNAFDALTGWKKEGLPPVEVPAAAQWKFRSKPFEQVILDYDYTFTTPYCGSETTETNTELEKEKISDQGKCSLDWEDCEEQIDVVALSSKDPILFYDEVVLYEDELSDNGVSLLTVKVRVMPSCWFLLLRFWLRVDGVLMRLRDTRMYCSFLNNANPFILRESCWREATFQSLSAKGFPSDSAAYSDPSVISQRLPVVMHKTQKLKISR